MSLPTWGRGLKHKAVGENIHPSRSLPTWGRGLKQVEQESDETDPGSLPTWGRGLKHDNDTGQRPDFSRSLHGGVD